MRVEWRLQGGAEALLLVDGGDTAVSEIAPPDAGILKAFLAVAETGETWRGWAAWRTVDGGGRDPDEWGELVLSRADNGAVISVDPELYWEGVYRWFLSRGVKLGP